MNVQDITEVRCGQQTRNFNLFPYVEVDQQSFSLIFEKEKGEEAGVFKILLRLVRDFDEHVSSSKINKAFYFEILK